MNQSTHQTKPLSGKIALVTGGARGIGRAISESLASEGADVAIHCTKKQPSVAEFAQHLQDEYGVHTAILTCDFRNPSKISDMFSQFDSEFSKLDIIVNNAGFETSCGLKDMPLEEWNDVINVNLTAPFLISQSGLQRMTDGGVVINISSIHEEIARKGAAHYSSAKSGLKMLGRSAALEWAEYGVRVITVSPGPIETDMNREVIQELGPEKFQEWVPLARIGQVEEISSVVSFLVSDKASYMTGTEIYVDGGYMRNLVRYDDRPTHKS